jgi:hypothetical protein
LPWFPVPTIALPSGRSRSERATPVFGNSMRRTPTLGTIAPLDSTAAPSSLPSLKVLAASSAN